MNTSTPITRAHIARRIEDATLASPWYELPPASLPAAVRAAFPASGVTEAIGRYAHGLQRTLWYVVRSHADGKWYAFGPCYDLLGAPEGHVMRTSDGRRSRWFRTRNNCRASVDIIEDAEQPDDPRW
jgi:hypothetical protein